ncbi:hypothetical protein ACERZ8_04890 [Tateyamaria armeniaca]|uniref:Uncharacterized protein n=1 Tax=Tateyamaria armeniaca TaxID=2518930 RepID=A0ABW8UQ44_9RHOB
MHRFIRSTYRLALHLQSSYMMLLVGLSFFTMPIFVLDGVLMRSLVFTLIALAVALVLRKPQWQPVFLREPMGLLQGFGAMLASSAVFIVAMALGYLAVINMNLPEPTSRNLATLTALPSLLLTGAMWWSALFLAVLPHPDGRPPRISPKRPTVPPRVTTARP